MFLQRHMPFVVQWVPVLLLLLLTKNLNAADAVGQTAPGVETLKNNPSDAVGQTAPGVETLKNNPSDAVGQTAPRVETLKNNPSDAAGQTASGVETLKNNPSDAAGQTASGVETLKNNPSDAAGQTASGVGTLKNNPVAGHLMEKINRTFIRPFIGDGSVTEIMDRFVPESVGQVRSGDSNAAAVAAGPFLNSLTNLLPGLRKIPGLSSGQFRSGNGFSDNPELNAAMEQFTAPLLRTVNRNGQASPADLEQFLNSIPKLVVNMPGFDENFDINKLDPQLIKSFLTGKGIPGIPSSTTDPIVKTLMTRMVDAAQAALEGRLTPEQERYLPKLDKIPHEMIGKVMDGGILPGLTAEETKTIKEYYTQKGFSSHDQEETNGFKQMLELLPPNYNLSRLSEKVIQTVINGEIPELDLFPKDVQDYIKADFEKALGVFTKMKGNSSIDGLIKKIPQFERPKLRTFDPYDLNGVNHELRNKETEEEKARMVRLYSGIVLGVIVIVTIAVLAFLYVHSKNRVPNHTSYHPSLDSPQQLKKEDILLTSTKIHPHVQ